MESFLQGLLISFPLVFLAMCVISFPECVEKCTWEADSKTECLKVLLSYFKGSAVVAGYVSLVVALVLTWAEVWVPGVKEFLRSVL